MICDWNNIDTVLLDMDGTLLDLHYDTHFWQTLVPEKYALKHNISFADAKTHLDPIFESEYGQLSFYCIDYWTNALDLDISTLKHETRGLIGERPGTIAFLDWLKANNKQIIMATNAHREILDMKLEETNIAPYFETMVSSHDYRFPKEDPMFWNNIQMQIGFNPARTLFIDDSISIVKAAQDWGIGHVLTISQPDSKQPIRSASGFPTINYLDETI